LTQAVGTLGGPAAPPGGHPAPLAPAKRRRQTSPLAGIAIALAVGAAPAAALAITVVTSGRQSSWFIPLLGITLLVNIGLVLTDLRYGLALFIVGAGLSPKLPGIYDNLRVEDLVFALVFGVWVLRNVQSGKLPAIRSPIIAPLALLTVLSLFSTVYGYAIGVIPDWKYSTFLQLKRIEYFLIFFVVATTVDDEEWLRALCLVFVASGAMAAGYGLVNRQAAYDQTVAETRVQGPPGENYNTLSGYLVICIGAGLAMLPEFKTKAHRLTLLICTTVAGAGLLLSFSREGYIMLVGSLTVFGFSRHRAILFLAAAALVAAVMFASPVRDGFGHTVTTIQNAQHDDAGSNSLTARFRAWEYRLNGWFLKQPVFGNGVGAVALSVDNEYVLRLCEVGVVGFCVFLWFLFTLGDHLLRLFRMQGLPSVIALGLSAGFAGMVIQGMAATSFTTIRTMEPFWFLLGLLYAALIVRRRQRLAPPKPPEPDPAVRGARLRPPVFGRATG
jgi:hypothetical protein